MSSQVDERPKTNGHLPADPELRTFRGRSLEEVLPQIRAELGPDAVVVRQREGLMGGIGGFFQQQFVEVQARPGVSRIDLYDEEPALPDRQERMFTQEPEPAPPAAPAPAPAAARRPPQPAPAKPAGGLSAAELLRAATGGGAVGDSRTPAEILREHSGTFARQLAAAELAEPVVSARQSAEPADEQIQPRRAYAPPRPPASVPARAEEPIPLPQKPAPAPAPDLPPAAEAAPASKIVKAPKPVPAAAAPVQPVVAVPAPDAPVAPAAPVASDAKAAAAPKGAPARRAAKRRAARAIAARPATTRAARPVRAAAKAKPAAARAAAKAPKPAAAAKPAPAPIVEDDPEPTDGGVGPQTTQALELAAAIAATVVEPAPAADTSARPPAAPAGTGAAPAAALPVRPAIPAPRRSLFARRARRGPTTPRRLVGGPEAAVVTEALATRGLAPAATEELLLDATAHVLPFTQGSDVRSAVRVALARRIPVPAPPRIGGRVVAFVGAGGGGKTRCSAGLAAAYAQGSTIPVACLTLAPADGGAELTGLLKPHGVRVEAVTTPEQAAKRLAELRADAVVVLDTPAVSPSDEQSIAALAALLAPLQLDEIQLVVPATLSATVAQELVERLAPLQPTGMAMTHADATEHIGAVVELACATRLPLTYVNSGLELPGALTPADPVALAERLLP